ncbi:ABC transporter ATP-binding protein [Sphingomonas lenta]|uniref:Multidrug ABC transporter ATP-binding protein n=1 Tax=Sphingomonas lenta TaxID=1141887 RepID=A0A2A2SFR1_9SPHN|nr:ABC transporter ATP-binding protein [Sphingomonas lenta]PAX08144.1 multidrug ABC transporter ATP-binding protein [Sphingomonas lenta]
MLEVEDVSHTYPDGTRALDGVTLSVARGLFGLLGPNGAGKSSLMRVVATLQRPTSGRVQFDGIDVLAEPRAVRRRLGYLPQDFGVYPGVSAAELLAQMAVLKGVRDRRSAVERLLRLVNLWDARDRAVSGFSGGMRQRWGVAQALLSDPDLLVVDEPTAGLDPEERNRFHDVLFGLGERAVVILSTHIVEDVANLCRRVGVLGGGRVLADGAPGDLVAAMRGRVWAGEAAPEGAVVASSRLVEGRRVVRVIGDVPPGPGFAPAEPDLEDAYFAALRGAS